MIYLDYAATTRIDEEILNDYYKLNQNTLLMLHQIIS